MVRARCLTAALVLVCWIWPFAGQAASPEAEKELSAGKQFFDHHKYDDAVRHFKKASKIERGACFECLVWLLRTQIATGDLKGALKNADRALPLASKDIERADIQLYQGAIYFRMANGNKDKLAKAEDAFRNAAAANPRCSLCRYNLGFVLLKQGKDAEGIETLKGVLSDFKNTTKEREILRFIADPSRARKDFAPGFSARSSNGDEINLDKLQGKVVLLDFWGAWCEPCRMSLPALKSLVAKMDPEKVVIISIDEGDSNEEWARFIANNRMTWVQIHDEGGEIADSYAVNSFPHYFVLSTDGIILAKMDGWAIGQEDTLRKAIEKALKN